MESKDKLFRFYSILAILILVLILVFKRNDQIVKIPKYKTVERVIEKQKDSVLIFNTKVVQDKKLIDTLNSKINGLQTTLETFKREKDTVRILHTQDELIGSLFEQSSAKDTLIVTLEKSVSLRDGIIKNQDTLLLIQKAKVKQVKRQRNISLLGNVILGGLLIIK